jgi:urease subunit alpha
MFGAFGKARLNTCITFLSESALENGVPERLGLKKLVKAVKNCRDIGKKDMCCNSRMGNIQVDPETYTVTVDGKVITCDAADSLPLAQRYFLF